MTPPHPSGDGTLSSRTHRGLFTLVLALAMGTGTFPAAAYGVLGPDLIEQFGLTLVELGLLTTTFFLVGGTLSLLAGPLTDRLGARRVMVASFLIVAVAVLGLSAAPSIIVLLGWSAVAGLALATGNPVTNKLVSLHLRVGQRGLTMGGKQAGVQLGVFMAGAVLAPLAVLVDWRLALAMTAVVPALAAGATLLVVPRDPVQVTRAMSDARHSLGAKIGLLAVYAGLMGIATSCIYAYLPLYLTEGAGFSQAQAGGVVALMGLMGVSARIAWGWASERVPSLAVPLVVFGVGGSVSAFLLIALGTANPWLAYLVAAMLGATVLAWNTVGMMAVLGAVGAQSAGKASGIVLFGFYGGFAPGPIAFGWIVDASGQYSLAWSLVASSMLMAAMVAAVWRRSEPTSALRATVPGRC
ncbi:MAG TPA: MFS transporter [Candidatus Limnocylindrales bacterium]|nr:MFS transporter [Candidatus Limnocylindrales bacterium]